MRELNFAPKGMKDNMFVLTLPKIYGDEKFKRFR